MSEDPNLVQSMHLYALHPHRRPVPWTLAAGMPSPAASTEVPHLVLGRPQEVALGELTVESREQQERSAEAQKLWVHRRPGDSPERSEWPGDPGRLNGV